MDTSDACVARIWQRLMWPYAANLDQSRAESFRRQQTTSARLEPDRRAASACYCHQNLNILHRKAKL